jgi:hypothetical protein
MTGATKIGVTGTRVGLTSDQRATAVKLLATTYGAAIELHHGDCVGADAELDTMGQAMGYLTVSHPPIHNRYRAHCAAAMVCEPKLYLLRNADIVNAVDVVLAFPKETTEAKQGGTWWTVRYARSIGRHLVIVWPDGTETP